MVYNKSFRIEYGICQFDVFIIIRIDNLLRHSEGEARKISYKRESKACERYFAFAQYDEPSSHSVLDTESVSLISLYINNAKQVKVGNKKRLNLKSIKFNLLLYYTLFFFLFWCESSYNILRIYITFLHVLSVINSIYIYKRWWDLWSLSLRWNLSCWIRNYFCRFKF